MRSSLPPRPATPACWAGWAGSGPYAWPASKEPAVTAPDWPATSPRPASGSSRQPARTRQDRRRQGKSDPLDAVSAARAAQSGRARGAPKGRDGAVEAIRTLMVARRSAAGERTRTINQARALVLTGPDDLRTRFARHTPAALITGLASLRPRPGGVAGYAVRVALRELGRRAQFLDGQLERLDELIVPLVTAHAPGLLTVYGLGPRTAALLLIAAGDHPGRLRSEAAWAHLCGVAPIPASSGKVTRHRLNPGGDR
ncbi:MAG TPA: transposase, partial [Streptosporangiaceae bacterium]